MHSKKILHRDIKPDNIFLNQDLRVKIGDFGISKILDESEEVAQSVIGTPFYFSPELAKQQSYGEKSDVWALGCLLYFMCKKQTPFCGRTKAELKNNILKGSD